MSKIFNDIGISEVLLCGLKKQGIENAMDVQEKVIPLALENKDIIAESPTGTGKTLAYLLPIIQRIDTSKREMQAIILAPTHELSMQIIEQVELLAKNSNLEITYGAFIGEVNIKRQVEKLKKDKPHIIIGSCGRINELIKMKKIKAHTVKTIVVDEGDRLLDQNNIGNVKDIVKSTLRDRQIMVFSATVNDETVDKAKEIMKDPEIVTIKGKIDDKRINHICIPCEHRKKIETLRKLIYAEKPEKAIVFLNKNEEIQLATSKLKFHKLKAYGIYGDASKEERKKAINKFKNGEIKILVSSDLGARGLDISNVTHIINLDLPEDQKEYLHRVGRTGRAGAKGKAISIVTLKERQLLKRYSRLLKFDLEEKELYKGALVDLKNGDKPNVNHKDNKSRKHKDSKENKPKKNINKKNIKKTM